MWWEAAQFTPKSVWLPFIFCHKALGSEYVMLFLPVSFVSGKGDVCSLITLFYLDWLHGCLFDWFEWTEEWLNSTFLEISKCRTCWGQSMAVTNLWWPWLDWNHCRTDMRWLSSADQTCTSCQTDFKHSSRGRPGTGEFSSCIEKRQRGQSESK